MKTQADRIQKEKSQSSSHSKFQSQSSGKSTFQFVDNRSEAIVQRNLQELANNSPQANKTAQLQTMVNNQSAQQQPIQKKENNTGLPDNLKTGVENLSGISLDDVKVHRNSDKPAQLQAHAYAQGTDIHLGAGQEKHLPHEAWHVVQQKQGRVKPTLQMKSGVLVNDETGLEKEADVMGHKALSTLTQLKQTAELMQGKFGTIQLVGEGDTEELLPDDKSIDERFVRIQTLGRQAEKLKGQILRKRRNDVLDAAKDLAKTWGKAAVFAGLDTLAPGLGTGLGYAEAAVGAAKDLNNAHKTSEVSSTAKETIAEIALTEGATQGLDAALSGAHWSAGAAIGSAKAVAKGVKAVGQSERGRKGEKITSILKFKLKVDSLKEEIMTECDELISHYQLGSRSDGPTAAEIKREQQIQKAKGRLETAFQAMTDYCEKNSEYVPLLGNQERSDD
jgi:hypothetical protein